MSKESVIAEIGIEIGEFTNGMNAVTASIDKTTAATKQMDSAMKSAGKSQEAASTAAGKSGYRMGQLSMQLQDVAVQAQAGTSALTIFAQQGSQIASIFNGASGAVIGGGLAIGAAIASLANNADTSFKNIVKEFQVMRSEISTGMSAMTLSELSNGLSKSEAKAKELTEAVNGTNIVTGFLKKEFADLASFASFGLLASGTEKIKADLEEQVAQIRLRMKIQEQALAVSDEEIALQKLKNSGDVTAVKLAEEKLRLRKELVKIDQSAFDDKTKVQLKDKEVDLSKEKVGGIFKDRQDEYEKDIAAQREKLDKEQGTQEEFNRKQVEDFQQFKEKEKKEDEDYQRWLADMRSRDEQDFIESLERKNDADKKSSDRLKKIGEQMEKDDVDANRKRIDKKIADEKRANDELKRIADKLRQDRIDAYAESPSAGRKFDKEQKQKEKDKKKGEDRVGRQEERERKKEEEKKKNAPKPLPKLGPMPQPGVPGGVVPPRPPMQPPAPAPANNAPGIAGNAMRVETLIVGKLQSK